MRIERCKEQGSQTLEDFYLDFVNTDLEQPQFHDIGSAMIQLLQAIRKTSNTTVLFGLTSLAKLYLLAEDHSNCDWYIGIIPGVERAQYRIDYLMPENIAPWRKARVTETASSIEEACKMIEIAIERSGGWT